MIARDHRVRVAALARAAFGLLLSCQDLSKSFGAGPLFERLSFGVFEGDHIGVVGPNGSGKSPLLRILAGLEEPSSGTRAAPPAPSGLRAQGSSLRSGRERRFDARRSRGGPGARRPRREARIGLVMGKAGFADGAQAVSSLSGGWKKRLAIARALAALPEPLLLDERS